MNDGTTKEQLDINRIFMETESAKSKPDWTNYIPQDVIENLHVAVMKQIFRYQTEFGRKPNYLLLNRTTYGVYKYIRRGMLESESLTGNSYPDFYEELEILCDPDQGVDVRVLPDAEFAFANLYNTEWEDLRLKYEKKFEDLQIKAESIVREKQDLLDRYEILGTELRKLRRNTPIIIILVLVVVLVNILFLR